MSLFLYRKGVLSLGDLFFCVRTYIRCLRSRLSLLDLHKLVFTRLFEGRLAKEMTDHVADFVSLRLSKMLYAPALREMHRWKEKGARLILLSGSPDLLVKHIAHVLGVSEGYGSEYVVDAEGKLAGLKHVLDGQWKADFVKAEADRYTLTQRIAYSDHLFDLPLLESVEFPIVVNPGRRLKKLARRRGWRILQ